MNDIRQDIWIYFESKGVFLLDLELDEIINISTSKILAMHDELYKENEELKKEKDNIYKSVIDYIMKGYDDFNKETICEMITGRFYNNPIKNKNL